MLLFQLRPRCARSPFQALLSTAPRRFVPTQVGDQNRYAAIASCASIFAKSLVARDPGTEPEWLACRQPQNHLRT